jgi:hypothetical protein
LRHLAMTHSRPNPPRSATEIAANSAKFTGYFTCFGEALLLPDGPRLGFSMQSLRVFCCRFAAD